MAPGDEFDGQYRRERRDQVRKSSRNYWLYRLDRNISIGGFRRHGHDGDRLRFVIAGDVRLASPAIPVDDPRGPMNAVPSWAAGVCSRLG